MKLSEVKKDRRAFLEEKHRQEREELEKELKTLRLEPKKCNCLCHPLPTPPPAPCKEHQWSDGWRNSERGGVISITQVCTNSGCKAKQDIPYNRPLDTNNLMVFTASSPRLR